MKSMQHVYRPLTDENRNDTDWPLPLDTIPIQLGISLQQVDGMSWTRQVDGQLVNLTVHFIPSAPDVSVLNVAGKSSTVPRPRPAGTAWTGLLPHEQRVIEEREQNYTRLQALTKFLQTPTFEGLDPVDRDLLREQVAAMNRFLVILDSRIDRFPNRDGVSNG